MRHRPAAETAPGDDLIVDDHQPGRGAVVQVVGRTGGKAGGKAQRDAGPQLRQIAFALRPGRGRGRNLHRPSQPMGRPALLPRTQRRMCRLQGNLIAQRLRSPRSGRGHPGPPAQSERIAGMSHGFGAGRQHQKRFNVVRVCGDNGLGNRIGQHDIARQIGPPGQIDRLGPCHAQRLRARCPDRQGQTADKGHQASGDPKGWQTLRTRAQRGMHSGDDPAMSQRGRLNAPCSQMPTSPSGCTHSTPATSVAPRPPKAPA